MKVSLNRRALTAGLAAVVCSLSLLSGGAQASASSLDYDPVVAAALAHLGSGQYTQADLNVIKAHPDIARHVPDPRPSAVTNGALRLTPAAVAALPHGVSEMATSCAGSTNTVDFWEHRKTVFGESLWYWHHMLQWCYAGGRIVNSVQKYDYVSGADSTPNVQELVASSNSATGGFSRDSFMQRHISYCLLVYGCTTQLYPYSTITARADGSWEGHGATNG